jgi:ABC-type enterochelin transport system, permease component
MHKNTKVILLLALLSVGLLAFYTFYGLNPDIYFYQLPSRLKRILAIIIVAVAIAVSTVIFQTIVKNRILTPSIMGSGFGLYLHSDSYCIFSGRELAALVKLSVQLLFKYGHTRTVYTIRF